MNKSTRLRKFNIADSITPDKVVVILGKRESGKSWALRDILYYLRKDIPSGVVMSGTDSATGFYAKHIPKTFIKKQFEPNIVSGLLRKQKRARKSGKEEGYESFLIFDDLMYDDSWAKHKTVKEIFFNGRHYKILFIITLQYCMGIGPNLRSNVDYVFMFREPNYENRRRLWKHWGGIVKDFKLFETILDTCTENFGCLVIDNRTKSNNLEDSIFWYKAKERPDFKVGSRSYWNIHYAKEERKKLEKKRLKNQLKRETISGGNKIVLA